MEQEIFGLPSLTLATYMGGILIAILSIILIGGLRRFILVKMGTKNIPRRKGQSTLIVVGLMLSSVIIATSLGIGDTVRYSVRSVVFESLGNADEVITGPGKVLFGDEYFEYSKFKDVQNIISQNSNIDAVLPYIEISLPAENDESGLAESNVTVRGIEETLSDNFDTLKNLDGATVSINSLQAGEVYINEGTQKKLKISKGGTLGIYSRAGKVDFVVKDILEGKGLAGSSLNSYILFELEELQSLVDKEGMITTIAISNTGKGEKSLESSEQVTKFLRSCLLYTSDADDE